MFGVSAIARVIAAENRSRSTANASPGRWLEFLMALRRNLSVACVIDARVAAEICGDRIRTPNASYDASVLAALCRLYGNVHLVRARFDTGRTLEELRALAPDVIFNLAFSATDLEAPFAASLALLGIPFTGSSAEAIGLANDKVRSRIALRDVGLCVPRFVALTRGADVPIDFEPPYIVKPVASASSAGIHADSLVKTRAGVRRLASRIWRRFQQPTICEQFIVGRELRVGIVDDAVTGVAEWKFSDGWGFKTEAIRGNARVRRARNVGRDAAQLTRGTMGSLVTIARRSVRALGVSGYATIDLRVDSEERLHVLELNANPGLWMHGLVWSRPGFDANIRRVVEVALRRG
jgi:D-alanine-D-alanine ligase